MEILANAASDRSAKIRRVAGEFLIKRVIQGDDGSAALALARQLAADPFPSVAERGRFALARLGHQAQLTSRSAR